MFLLPLILFIAACANTGSIESSESSQENTSSLILSSNEDNVICEEHFTWTFEKMRWALTSKIVEGDLKSITILNTQKIYAAMNHKNYSEFCKEKSSDGSERFLLVESFIIYDKELGDLRDEEDKQYDGTYPYSMDFYCKFYENEYLNYQREYSVEEISNTTIGVTIKNNSILSGYIEVYIGDMSKKENAIAYLKENLITIDKTTTEFKENDGYVYYFQDTGFETGLKYASNEASCGLYLGGDRKASRRIIAFTKINSTNSRPYVESMTKYDDYIELYLATKSLEEAETNNGENGYWTIFILASYKLVENVRTVKIVYVD